MDCKAVSTLVIIVVALSSAGQAAEVTGSLYYDDLPLATAFPDVQWARASASPTQGGAQIFGTVDLASSTYSIEDLETAEYRIYVELFRTDPSPWVGYPGDLTGTDTVQPTDPGESIERDLDLQYYYHVVSPIDSLYPLDGLRYDCTDHPAVPYPVTFTIEAVPRATAYRFEAALRGCPAGALDYIYLDSAEPSVQVEWGTADEDFQILTVDCTGASGKELCATPLVQYTDGDAWRLALTEGGSSSRGTHRTDAVVVAAAAAISGAQGTYWSTAMTVANLADKDRTIDFFYTPRDNNGLETFSKETVSISANSQLTWTDVLAEIFATTGAGALELRGADLAVTTRTSTPAAGAGSYGQGIPPLQPEQVLSAHGEDTATIGGVEEGTVFRTNLGLCEIWGEAATVRVTILDGDMNELGSEDLELRPYENTQVNRVAKTIVGLETLSGGLARVTVLSGDGKVGAYLSVVDGSTGDPTFIAIAPQAPSGG